MSDQVFTCPLCSWKLVVTPTTVSDDALASVFGPGIMAAHARNESARKVEESLQAHFETHKMPEWVTAIVSCGKANTALANQTVRLRDKLLEIANECSSCGGTGCVTITEDGGLGAQRVWPCDDCADIRELLE
jgi:hypothetical protein